MIFAYTYIPAKAKALPHGGASALVIHLLLCAGAGAGYCYHSSWTNWKAIIIIIIIIIVMIVIVVSLIVIVVALIVIVNIIIIIIIVIIIIINIIISIIISIIIVLLCRSCGC